MTTMSDVHTMGVKEIAEAVAKKELSPVDVAGDLLDRISKYDGQIRAISFMERESVLIEAQAMADEAVRGVLRGPLHGVPLVVKEQFALGGAPQRADWTNPDPPISPEDATVIANLRAAGALVIGKAYMTGGPTGMPPTRNPWNLEYSPGGSSSGSGAAVGARFVPFALAEQSGGSGIRPAAYNGVSGLKPTFGRNSRHGMFTMSYSNDYPCVIATSVADIVPVFAVTAGYDPLDHTSRFDGAWKGAVTLTRAPKIGVVRNFFPQMTEPEMQTCIEAAAQKLAAGGVDVVDYYLPPDYGAVWANAAVVSLCEGSVVSAKKIAAGGKERGSATTPTPVTKFSHFPRSASQLIPASFYLQGQRVRRYLRDLVDTSLGEGGLDAILMPTAPGAAPHNNTDSGDATLCACWSHLGQPALSMPGGLDSAGMPLGLQLVGQTMSDEHLLATGAWCQEILGVLPPPDLSVTTSQAP